MGEDCAVGAEADWRSERAPDPKRAVEIAEARHSPSELEDEILRALEQETDSRSMTIGAARMRSGAIRPFSTR